METNAWNVTIKVKFSTADVNRANAFQSGNKYKFLLRKGIDYNISVYPGVQQSAAFYVLLRAPPTSEK